jgi:sirohydrochlorin cobaltochelatase
MFLALFGITMPALCIAYNRRMTALILFVHGARDPRWAVPFERLRNLIAARSPDIRVKIAFLEHARPDLTQAATELAEAGARRIKVVPLFFGRGGHLREDFPRQLAAAQSRLGDVRFDVTDAAGEDDGVLDALATFALEAPAGPHPSIK